MRKFVYPIALTVVLVILAALIHDYFTVSKSEAQVIAERYIAAQSFKWTVDSLKSEEGAWVARLAPVEHVPEAAWLYIDKHSGDITTIVESE